MSGAAPLLPQVPFVVCRGTAVCYIAQDGRTAVRTAQWYRTARFKISWNWLCLLYNGGHWQFTLRVRLFVT